MRVLFSTPHPLGQDGPSRPHTRIMEALGDYYGGHFRGISRDHFPQLNPSAALGDAIGPCYDDLAAREEQFPMLDGDVALFGAACLSQMAVIKQEAGFHSIDPARLGTLWFSSHWAYANKVLVEESPAYGLEPRPIHPYVTWRAEAEQNVSDFLVVPSEACKRTYPADLQEKIHIAEFGVDCKEFEPPAVKPASDALRILYPATNPVRKGLRYALHAAGVPWNRWAMTITGGLRFDSSRLDLFLPDAFGSSSGVPPIEMPGWVTNQKMRELYQTHDALLLPSLEEGQALAVLEGMACGLVPIITPECGYLVLDMPATNGQFLIPEEKCALVVPSRDGLAVRNAVQYLVDNPAERKRMGREARAFAEKRPWSFFTDRIVEIIATEAGR